MKRSASSALAFQAVYYLSTGLWPFVSMRSFEAVTGPKVDRWLVRMVGLLAACDGATIAAGLGAKSPSRETQVLAISSALAFAAIDVAYVCRGRISPIYLGDAAIELALVFRHLKNALQAKEDTRYLPEAARDGG